MTFVNPQFGMIPELQDSMAIRVVAYGHRCLAIGDAEKVTHEDLEFVLRDRCHVSASALPIKVFISRTDHEVCRCSWPTYQKNSVAHSSPVLRSGATMPPIPPKLSIARRLIDEWLTE